MTSEMKGRKQLERAASADVEPTRLWAVLIDSRLLPKWAAAVDHVEKCDGAGERVGAVRHCRVHLGGRAGQMVERCVELVPKREIAYVVDDDSFGMSRMFQDYGFRITLRPIGDRGTRVSIETFYTPRNGIYALLNSLVMRRRFRAVVDELLSGLIGYARTLPGAAAAASPAGA